VAHPVNPFGMYKAHMTAEAKRGPSKIGVNGWPLEDRGKRVGRKSPEAGAPSPRFFHKCSF